MEMPQFLDEDPLLLQNHEVPITSLLNNGCNLLTVPARAATIVRSNPVASHTLSLTPPADAALGRRVGNEMMQSIWDFEFENGRRYHGYKAGSYPLPNDEVLATTHLSQMTHCTALSGV